MNELVSRRPESSKKNRFTTRIPKVRFSYVNDNSKVEETIIQALETVQQLGGHAQQQIGKDTVPLRDLPGFDSLTGVETTSLLAEQLACEISTAGKRQNLFVSENGYRMLTVTEIAERLRPVLGMLIQ